MEKFHLAYLGHSGFVLELADCVLIFDYYIDPAGKLPQFFKAGKPVYVFASHVHSDHFSPAVFQWEKHTAAYILHSGCRFSDMPENVRLMEPGEERAFPEFTVHMYGSTDEGGSFMIRHPQGRIFHAGDLNWWHWAGESDEENRRAGRQFMEELGKIGETEADIAFFPVDARLEVAREWGVKRFLECIKIRTLLIPMHACGARWCPSYEFRWRYRDTPLWIPVCEGEEWIK